MDLPVPGRPHPGDRHRRPRPQAVPLPPEVARSGATRRSSTTCSRFARALPALREARRRATSARDDLSREQRPRVRRRGCSTAASSASAPRTTRSTNETYGLATMRKDHVTPARRHACVFDYPAKHGKRRVQSVVDPEVAEIVARAQAPPRRRRRAARLQARPAAGSTCARRTSTRTSRTRRAWTSRAKDFRTWGATVLAAVGARRRRRRRHAEDRAQARGHPRGQGGRPLPRQHAGGRPRVLHRPARLRPLPRRPDDRPRARRIGDDEDATAIQGPVEEAVLDLLEGPRSSEHLERVA